MNLNKNIYLGLGSNIEEKIANIKSANNKIASIENTVIEKYSSFYETEPREFAEQENFINAVVKIKSSLKPEELFIKLKNIENELGRIPTFKYGPRIIDIDILLFGDEIIETQILSIPHKKIVFRKFVLIPLAEIDSNLIIPGIEKNILQVLEICSDSGYVKKLEEVII
ncbi:MAG: 2-amino-4-hydroxy-6-hydroxymethyldihydropteridine diphosphokinase [Bacteroidetes bacterium]|nr:2-amino-4-hydroxy-6-hydroxymethyldihydropteridine diphosphokinase [Bacteroidota bacterium]